MIFFGDDCVEGIQTMISPHPQITRNKIAISCQFWPLLVSKNDFCQMLALANNCQCKIRKIILQNCYLFVKFILWISICIYFDFGHQSPTPPPRTPSHPFNFPIHFQWVTGGWSECNLVDKRGHCGRGHRTRAIR